MKKSKQREVIIVIPVYRPMTVYERVSLRQCIRILGQYPIVLVAGASMDVSDFLPYCSFQVERFGDDDFFSTESYSRLLLSDRFYARFATYRYLLIYQLDAFVFSDRLLEFCRQGYDYIGAPIPRWAWQGKRNRVGNGGFSLRRIDACRRVLRAYPPNAFLSGKMPEDHYFAFCAEVPDLAFRVPSIRAALEFSVDFDVFRCYRWMPGWLPFGCHAWDSVDYDHWRPVIERCGYDLPEMPAKPMTVTREEELFRYLWKRLLRPAAGSVRTDCIRKAVREKIPGNRVVVLWGWGTDGHRLFRWLTEAEVGHMSVFDQNGNIDGDRVPVLPALDFEAVRNGGMFVLISTRTYEDEISETLAAHGLHEDRDYAKASTFIRCLLDAYFERFNTKR